MKSLRRGNLAGNAKLRGKRSKMLPCRCCDIYNFKSEYLVKLAEKEAQEFKVRPVTGESLRKFVGSEEQG